MRTRKDEVFALNFYLTLVCPGLEIFEKRLGLSLNYLKIQYTISKGNVNIRSTYESIIICNVFVWTDIVHLNHSSFEPNQLIIKSSN